MAKEKRKGKVFVDWSQNDRHKTTVSAYSLRLARPPDRLDAACRGTKSRRSRPPTSCEFEAPDVLGTRRRLGDLYEASLTVRQELPQL